MPPKKSQNKEPGKKKTSEKCNFNNRGYCNLKEQCEKTHSDNDCDNFDCNEEECTKRHPNPCKFGPRCKYNRKNECLYLHVTLPSNDEKFKALNQSFNNKFLKLENIVKQMQTDLEKKDSELIFCKGKVENLEKLIKDTQFSKVRKDLEEKNALINGLEIKMQELEEDYKAQKQQQDKKIKDVENALKQKANNSKDSDNKICEENSFKCGKCDYISTTRQGLKIHSTKIHSKIDFEKFPAVCNVCEKVFENETILKKHKKTDHTYHTVKYQCNECEFMANKVQTLQVHFGAKHSTNKQCGLCDKEFESTLMLDEHQSHCEIIMCSNSGCKETFGHLLAIKEHISSEHRKNSPEHYSFSYWIVNSKDKTEKEISEQFLTIYPKDW